jgi:hypothetical protein
MKHVDIAELEKDPSLERAFTVNTVVNYIDSKVNAAAA